MPLLGSFGKWESDIPSEGYNKNKNKNNNSEVLLGAIMHRPDAPQAGVILLSFAFAKE